MIRRHAPDGFDGGFYGIFVVISLRSWLLNGIIIVVLNDFYGNDM